MVRRQNRLVLQALALVSDGVVILAGVLLAYSIRFSDIVTTRIPVVTGQPPIVWYVNLALLLCGISLIFFIGGGLYRFPLQLGWIEDIAGVLKRFLFGYTLLLAGIIFYRSASFSRLTMALLLIICVILLIISRTTWMIIRQQLHRRGKVVLRAIVVGEGLQVERIKSQIANHPQYGLALIGAVGDEMTSGDLDCLGGINDIGEIVRNHRIDTLIVAAGVNQVSLVERLVRACYGLNVDFLYLPEVDLPTGGPRRIIEVGGVPLWALKETPFDGWPGLVKRTFDFIVSLLLIVMLAPIFLVIILLVKLTSKGPVFYRQRRIGLDGREFDCIKFRSMMVDAEAQTGPIWAKSGDERVTSWGRLLRRFSLDELPQLWNILRGDMSLVGPRPERPEFVQKFTEHLEGYSERHRVRTGLTGWAQVNGLRGDTSIEERLKFDRHYIENWSLGFDVKILFMTLYAVIKGENSY